MEFQRMEVSVSYGFNPGSSQHASNYTSSRSTGSHQSGIGISFDQDAMLAITTNPEGKELLSETHNEPNIDHQNPYLRDDSDFRKVHCRNSSSPNRIKHNGTELIRLADGDHSVHLPLTVCEKTAYWRRSMTGCSSGIAGKCMIFDDMPRQDTPLELMSGDASNSAVTIVCMTCYGTDPNKLQLDATFDKLLPRLKPDSTVRCFMDCRSFRRGGLDDVDINHAKEALKKVIRELNSLRFRLTFEYVRQKDQRDFTLAYDIPDEKRPGPNFFAYAFFPDARQSERKIKLTSTAFKDEYRQSIFNILCHEFAHTLGMRHWNAATKEAFRPSVQHPPNSDNERSVMGPYIHPSELHFHPEDAEWLRDFYARAEGEVLYGHTIVDIAIS